MQGLTVLLVLGVAVAIFLTTPAGKRVTAHLGLRLPGKGVAPKEDHEYLLRICNGDFEELAARLRAASKSNPDITEAQAYRKAIRTHLRDKM